MRIVKTNTRAHIKAKFCVAELKRYFDTKNFQDLYYRSIDYKEFLQMKLNNSTIAGIAMQEEMTTHPLRFPDEYKQNLAIFSRYSDFTNIFDMLKKQKEELYPKTGCLREVLIKENRFSLDYVKPKLISKYQKLALKIRSLF